MKFKYTETTTTTKQIYLLDILNLENDYERENFFYENDSTKIEITFWAGFKGVIITFIKSNLKLSFDTNRISPEKIIEAIESIMKTLGVEYEN